MSPTPSPVRGSYRVPSVQHALVEDVMRAGVVTCAPQTDLVSVAQIMAANHIHAIVVTGIERSPAARGSPGASSPRSTSSPRLCPATRARMPAISPAWRS